MLHHIEADRITIEMAVALIALALAAHPKLDSYDLSSLRCTVWCATPVTSVAEAVTAGRGELGDRLRHQRIAGVACNSLEGAKLDTVGRPVPGVDVRVVSLEDGKPVGSRCRRFRPGRIR